MPDCLGLYIENNIIKYAKLSKDKEQIKVESYGIKFYDKISEAIKQVIAETYSYKTPIAVNLSEEAYNYFYMFNLLNKRDMGKAIETEFESFCNDKGFNVNALESRYALVNSFEDKEKIKVIHVSANKSEINRRLQQLEAERLTNIAPLPIAITNLLDLKEKENIAIVNIEEKTTVTSVIEQKIYDINVIEDGTSEILTRINLKENSFSKAYEICKNTTIYTSEGKELQDSDTENVYLEEIMPTLYNIVGQVQKIINESLNKIEKVYITGTASVINNIDLYFQEYLGGIKCEILKPYFIKNTMAKINIKDYVEVNSAMALALQGLGEGLKSMNFKKPTLVDQIPDWLKIDVGGDPTKDKKKDNKILGIPMDLKEKLDHTEKSLIRIAITLFVIIVIYGVFSFVLSDQISQKGQEVQAVMSDTRSQISLISNDTQKVRSKTNEYTNLIQNLKQINDQIVEKYETKNSIPNLLDRIMSTVPAGVQITAINNTTGRQITINAQAEGIEQLGYFKAVLKTEGILTNVVSDSGVKEGGVVKVTIEGELP